MNQILSTIDFFGPFLVIPLIPKITIIQDGFLVNNTKVLLNDIVCARYRNLYSPNNTLYPFVGQSFYEVLTSRRRIYFYGEHYNLLEYFDNHFEKESVLKDDVVGMILRWRKPGKLYKTIYFRDWLDKYLIEKYGLKKVNTSLVFGIIITIILVGFFAFLWFIWALIKT